MQQGPLKKSRYNKNPVPFTLRKALENNTQFLVSTTLPSAEHINKLWDIVDELRDEIALCLNLVYSHITSRGAHNEGQEHFFHHVAGTALYETHQQKLIKGKNHGLKAGTILTKLVKTIKKIESKLQLDVELSDEHREILENFKAELLAHHNTIVAAIKRLPEKHQEHLKRYQNIDPQTLLPIELTTEDEFRIAALHPKPEQITPKKLSKAARASTQALQSTEPPTDTLDFDTIFAQLSRGTSFEKPTPKPAAMKKLAFYDQDAKDEIDAIFDKLENKTNQKTLTVQFKLSITSSTTETTQHSSVSISVRKHALSK